MAIHPIILLLIKYSDKILKQKHVTQQVSGSVPGNGILELLSKPAHCLRTLLHSCNDPYILISIK